ncbi:hypothetical protein [Carboxylicivirga sp. N1Y90]|uniref:hypothetical protein n=1 Tax=Carboxylicivirga fragile TaxID=3417571 RepID=UPI003D352FCF|nr:hypothetical protein [Marinilabiliaceae bacterium N1Y90]
MNIYRPLIISIISLISLTIYATEQTPDKLIYKSDTIYLETYPFEILMDSDSLIRKQIYGDSEDFCISSGCWRGHVATWTIENDSLFLTKLIDGCEEFEFKLNKVFRNRRVINNKVFADWFTGDLLEYESWFVLIDDNDSVKNTKRFNLKIANGKILKLTETKTDCEKASNQAKKDFVNSDYSFHSLEFLPIENTYTYLLNNYYDIKWYFTDDLEYYDCYDSVMTIYLKDKYGYDFLDKAQILADSLEQTDNWITNAEYIGGTHELMQYILTRLEIDKTDMKDGIKTKLYIEVEIDTTGKAINPIIRKGFGEKTDKKVKEIINEMPNWKPAYLYGKPTRQKYFIPLNIDYQ